MKSCRHCGHVIASAHQFCARCGQPLGAEPAAAAGVPAVASAASDLTTRMIRSRPVGTPLPVDLFTSRAGELHRSIAVEKLFTSKNTLVIGRSPGCDICLPHSSISRTHALLQRLPDGIRLLDWHSVNGVLVGGTRTSEPVYLRERERIGIGPYLFCLADGVLHALDSSQSLRLEGRNLEKVVPIGRGKTRKLLDNINLAVEPGEFVSLLGPSGSGKSTLMDCLNGRRPASRGQVLANGEDFYRHFDSFRQSLGYVPQRDIVHSQLTVYKALYFTGRLRLPPDTGAKELQARIDEVLRLMELEPHRDTMVGLLSGGQIKRVSLGAELLARPCLLYIDEATSGLDAGTEARMMRLFRQLTHEGKSVLCITHNVEHIDLCDLILILAEGRLVYYGPPAEGLKYFHAGRVTEVYDRLAEKDPQTWEKEFACCSLYRTFVANRLGHAPAESVMMLAAPAPSTERRRADEEAPRPLAKRRRHPVWHQLRVLTARYLELLWRDQRTLRLLVLQAPLVAGIILLSLLNKPFQTEVLAARSLTADEHALLTSWLARLQAVPARNESLDSAIKRLARDPRDAQQVRELLAKIPFAKLTVQDVCDKGDLLLRSSGPLIPERLIVNPTYTYILLCLLVITILWFGCNNAAKEIVKEEAIYNRERAVNLGIVPYLSSKFVVLSIISAVQVLFTMAIIYGGLEIMHLWRGDEVPAAIYRLDYLPQFGVLVLLSMTGVALGLLLSACVGHPDRAATLLPYVLVPQIILTGGILPIDSEPLNTIAKVTAPSYWAFRAIRTGETALPADFPWHMSYDDNIWLACAALLAQMAGLLLLTAWMLRRWDVRRT